MAPNIGEEQPRGEPWREAIAASEKAAELAYRAGFVHGDSGYTYAMAGKRAEAIAAAKEMEVKYARKEAPGLFVAEVYAGLGEKDKAFEWLEKDFQTRSGNFDVRPESCG